MIPGSRLPYGLGALEVRVVEPGHVVTFVKDPREAAIERGLGRPLPEWARPAWPAIPEEERTVTDEQMIVDGVRLYVTQAVWDRIKEHPLVQEHRGA